MTRCVMPVIALAGALAAGCHGTPSSPSATSAQATQSTVTSAIAQAMGQAIAVPLSGDSNTFTYPCPGGGSIVSTFSGSFAQGSNVLTNTSRSEFHDCKNGSTTMNGDPYLDSTNQTIFAGPGATGNSVSTMSTTGGLRFDMDGGVSGRVHFNCTMVMSIQAPTSGTPPPPSVTWSGTLTWEQPLGSAPVTRPCAPTGS